MTSLPRYLVLGAAGLLLAGCAASLATTESWSKGGATQEAAAASLRQCVDQASVALRVPVDAEVALAARTNGTRTSNGEIPNDSPSARRDRLIGRCMIMRGYLIER